MPRSPLLYSDTLVVPMGGRGQALAAFNAETGALVWKAGDFEFSPASPVIIDVDGQTQLVYFARQRSRRLRSRDRAHAVEPSA